MMSLFVAIFAVIITLLWMVHRVEEDTHLRKGELVILMVAITLNQVKFIIIQRLLKSFMHKRDS